MAIPKELQSALVIATDCARLVPAARSAASAILIDPFAPAVVALDVKLVGTGMVWALLADSRSRIAQLPALVVSAAMVSAIDAFAVALFIVFIGETVALPLYWISWPLQAAAPVHVHTAAASRPLPRANAHAHAALTFPVLMLSPTVHPAVAVVTVFPVAFTKQTEIRILFTVMVAGSAGVSVAADAELVYDPAVTNVGTAIRLARSR
jgi:hypothetical protein